MSETPAPASYEPHGSSGPSRWRSPRLRWAVPVGAAAVVVGALVVPVVANASPRLAPKSPAELLAAVGGAGAVPLSGTVVETARLGLPALPDTGSSLSPAALVTGSHTLRVWYDGGDKARLALVGPLAETDLVRNGSDVWLWTSGANTAQHATLPAHDATSKVPAPTAAADLTPQQAAAKALAAVDPTTKVSLGPTTKVAGRSAYQLVLEPRDTRSLVGSVRIAIDSDTSVPLRVSVWSAGSTGRPAFETGFTSVAFHKPAASVFRFSPPAGAKVSQLGGAAGSRPDAAAAHQKAGSKPAQSGPKVVGTGWTAVVELTGVDLATAPPRTHDRHGDHASAADQLGAITKAMSPVSGSYGTGHVLRTALVSVLVLDDGRAFVGAVPPSVLEAAAAA